MKLINHESVITSSVIPSRSVKCMRSLNIQLLISNHLPLFYYRKGFIRSILYTHFKSVHLKIYKQQTISEY